MANTHTLAVIPTKDGQWVGSCSCRWRAPSVCATAQEAEDSNLKHAAEVEKLRAYTRRSQPSMREMRDYYLAKAEEESGDVPSASLWKQLADEITHRLNDGAPPNEGHPRLF